MVRAKYDKLLIKYSPKRAEVLTNNGIENRYFYYIKEKSALFRPFIYLTQKSSSICKKLVGFFDSFSTIQNDKKDLNDRIKKLNNSELDVLSFGSGYGYDDEIQEFSMVLNYYKEIKTMSEGNQPLSDSMSMDLYQEAINTLSKIFSDDKNAKIMVNFGVGYAYIDSELAKKFSECSFIGTDRSKLTKTFNDSCFGNIKNLHIDSRDIFEILANNRFDGGIFFTSRTLIVLPKPFIEKLYSAVEKAGFRYIVGFEPVGISRQTNLPYEFSETEKPSVVYRGFMYIHNYPELLIKAGYEIPEIDLIKTGHPHKDVRLLNLSEQKNPCHKISGSQSIDMSITLVTTISCIWRIAIQDFPSGNQ